VSWVTTSTNNAGVNPVISFTIADWAGSQGSTRTANFAIRHWLYDAGDPQSIHEATFQIIQHAENQVTVTTTQATAATTLATTTLATTPATGATNATTPATNATAAIYTITYNANGGAGTTPSTSGPLPLTVANNNFTRAGWTFNNWHTESSGSGSGQGMTYNEGATYNAASDDILYAQWYVTPTTEAPSIQLTGMLNPPIAPVGGVSAQIPFTVTPNSPSVTWSGPGVNLSGAAQMTWVTDANGTAEGSIPTWITNVTASTDAGGNGLLTYTVASQSTSTGPQGPAAS